MSYLEDDNLYVEGHQQQKQYDAMHTNLLLYIKAHQGLLKSLVTTNFAIEFNEDEATVAKHLDKLIADEFVNLVSGTLVFSEKAELVLA